MKHFKDNETGYMFARCLIYCINIYGRSARGRYFKHQPEQLKLRLYKDAI
jgi:hypothetical protein